MVKEGYWSHGLLLLLDGEPPLAGSLAMLSHSTTHQAQSLQALW